MKTIRQKYIIHSPLPEVWKGLTDPKYINEWGGGPSKMDDKNGTEFEFWGGEIHGKNIEVVPLKKLKQEWFSGNWDQASIVTFTLTEKNGETRIGLLHTDIPDNEVEDIDEGWKDYYLDPLKEYLERK